MGAAKAGACLCFHHSLGIDLGRWKIGEEGEGNGPLLCGAWCAVSGHFRDLTAVSAQTELPILIAGILVSPVSLTSKLSC